MDVLAYLKDNAYWLVPAAMSLLASLRNAFKSRPAAEGFLDALIDVLSCVSYKGEKGLAGRASVPGLRSKKAAKPQLKAINVLLPLALVGGLAGCACWSAERRNAPECAVLHGVLDCTEDAALSTLAPALAEIIHNAIENAASPDWSWVLAQLKGAGVKDGGCILAQLVDQFLRAPAAPGGAKSDALDALEEFKLEYNIDKICVNRGGRRICL